MPDVAFVARRPSAPALRFLSALTDQQGVRASLVCENVEERIPNELRGKLAEVVGVSDATDTGLISHAVEELRRRGQDVSLLLGTEKDVQLPIAVMRERLGLPGLPPHAAANFLDPSRAADVLRGRGFPSVEQTDAGGTRSGLVGIVLEGGLAWHVGYEDLPAPPELAGPEHPGFERVRIVPREPESAAERTRSAVEEAMRALGLRDGMCHAALAAGEGEPALADLGAWPPEPWMLEAIAWGQGLDPYRAWAEAAVGGRAPRAAPTHAVGVLVVPDARGDLGSLAGPEDSGLEARALGPDGVSPAQPGDRSGTLLLRHRDGDALRDALWKILGRYDSVDA